MLDQKSKLIAIIGPTASGKTDLALNLARQFNGEIICADSRTIYRGMDIGTAKPSREEQSSVPHHLLDMVEPSVTYSAQQFQQAAYQSVKEISGRGKTPFMVGGSGLYAYSVIYNFSFPAGARSDLREKLEAKPLAELVEQLRREDPERAGEIDLQNSRRVIRALETVGQPRTKTMVLPPNVLLLGLRPDKDTLNQRIVQRTKAMFQIGLVEEVRQIINEYGADLEVLRSPGYAEVVDYLSGKTSLEEAEALINLHTNQLVKKQVTWFRRNKDIVWLDDAREAETLVRKFLAQ